MPLASPWWRDKTRKRRNMAPLPLPVSVEGREVGFGAGLHMAVWAATRAAAGFAPPLVFEQNLATGGVFAQLQDFRMNSVNQASVQSVATGTPSRIVPASPSDDLNWIPNSPYQAADQAGGWEYPTSGHLCRAIQKTLKDYAVVYTGAKGMKFDSNARVFTAEGEDLGVAKRIIFAGGVVPKDSPGTGGLAMSAVVNGFDFLAKPPRELHNLKIAIVGGGDTAAQVAEYMLGQGLNAPSTPPRQIHWYGGLSMPMTKDGWMVTAHARWVGLGRHFPQRDGVFTGVVKPFAAKGKMIPLGKMAMVNGQMYDLVVMCTGVQPAPCPVDVPDVYSVGGMNVAKSNASQMLNGVPKVFTIGIAAQLGVEYRPYKTRFAAAGDAIYNLAPRTAALAASLK